MCCHSTGTLLLVFWDTTEDALCADSCFYFCRLNCKLFTLFFPAVSLAGNEFNAEIIQLQLLKCLILSGILIFSVFIAAIPRNRCDSFWICSNNKVHKRFYLAYRNRTSKEKTNCAKQKRFLMCVSYFVNDFVQEIRMLWYMELKCSLSEWKQIHRKM